MMDNNFQEYDYGMEYFLLIYNKPFHFCSKNTYMTFLLISFQNKGHINMNQTIKLSLINYSDLSFVWSVLQN